MMSRKGEETSGAAPRRQGDNVQSVDRAMVLLEVLSEDDDGFRLTDLARRASLSPSTTHRLLTTLERRSFVQFDRLSGLWHVGRQAFFVGSAFGRHHNLSAPALPYLRHLRDVSRETANLGVVVDGDVVFLTQIESREIIRAITRVGGRAPMFTSGMGKAILSTYSTKDVKAAIERYGLRAITVNTRTRPASLLADLAEARLRGYAIDDEEFAIGLRCVAAVVYDHLSEPLYAISISGLAARMSKERLPQLGRLVADTARELTRLVGGVPPASAEGRAGAEAEMTGTIAPFPASGRGAA